MDSQNTAVVTSSGFGLLEILIATVMLGLVGSSTFYFLRAHNFAASKNSDLNQGMLLGKSKLDSLRISNYGSIATGCDTVKNHFIRRWYVSTDLVTEKKAVKILISWPLSVQQTISLNTIVGKTQEQVF